MSKRSTYGVLIALAVVIAGVALYLFAGGGGKTAQARELDANLQRWQSLGASHYRMEVNVMCFCPWRSQMPVTVEVENGRVVSVTDREGRSIPEDDPLRSLDNAQLLTVDGIFEYARQAIPTADETTITYDPTRGFPVSLHIDRIKMAMDDEMTIEISSLQILP